MGTVIKVQNTSFRKVEYEIYIKKKKNLLKTEYFFLFVLILRKYIVNEILILVAV